MLNLLIELKSWKFQFTYLTPVVKCHTFEDNKSSIEIATNHNTHEWTKHLSVRLHHFCSHIIDKTISIEHILTFEQIANIFTKPLASDQFRKLRKRLMGWSVDARKWENMRLPNKPMTDNRENLRLPNKPMTGQFYKQADDWSFLWHLHFSFLC